MREVNTTPCPQVIPPVILVLGDMILDRYTWGDVPRVSPEAPVPVLLGDHEEVRLGGAGSVARLLRSLDSNVEVLGVIGHDSAARTFKVLCADHEVVADGVLMDSSRPTTSKHRFLGRAHGRNVHQMLRVDHESTAEINGVLQESLWRHFQTAVTNANAVVIADYGKGVCAPGLVKRVIELCQQLEVPVLVDPARQSDCLKYAGATVLKPNRVEAEAMLGQSSSRFATYTEMAEQLLQRCQTASVALTLDGDGIVVANGQTTTHLPTVAREVVDITGAGDAVIAMFAFGAAVGWSLEETARLANISAGIQVSKVGVEPSTWREIREQDEFSSKSVVQTSKVADLLVVATATECARRLGKKIVFTNGCFDLFHIGHLRTLQMAAEQGDFLVVGINSDESVKRLKGMQRPIVGEQNRAAILSAIDIVDYVVIYDDDTPNELLKTLRPDFLVKGGTTPEIVGREIVEEYGGTTLQTCAVSGVSTSELIDTITSVSTPLSQQ